MNIVGSVHISSDITDVKLNRVVGGQYLLSRLKKHPKFTFLLATISAVALGIFFYKRHNAKQQHESEPQRPTDMTFASPPDNTESAEEPFPCDVTPAPSQNTIEHVVTPALPQHNKESAEDCGPISIVVTPAEPQLPPDMTFTPPTPDAKIPLPPFDDRRMQTAVYMLSQDKNPQVRKRAASLGDLCNCNARQRLEVKTDWIKTVFTQDPAYRHDEALYIIGSNIDSFNGAIKNVRFRNKTKVPCIYEISDLDKAMPESVLTKLKEKFPFLNDDNWLVVNVQQGSDSFLLTQSDETTDRQYIINELEIKKSPTQNNRPICGHGNNVAFELFIYNFIKKST